MKFTTAFCWLALLAATGLITHADIDVPSDGSDGDLILTDSGTPREVIIDLSRAPDGVWDARQTGAIDPELGGPGIYDFEKWAVVFKYNSVRIEKNVTVRFKNHDSRAPVVWLVASNIVIEGALLLNAEVMYPGPKTAEGGPGGSRGVFKPGPGSGYRGYLMVDQIRVPESAIPLRGGFGYLSEGNSGGGGAILLCSRYDVTLDGHIELHGRTSNGVLRIVADTFRGNGNVYNAHIFRLEVNNRNHSVGTSLEISYANPDLNNLWPATNSPSVEIVSVESAVAPSDPRASLSPEPFPSGRVIEADMTIRKVGASKILIETKNFPASADSKVMLFALPNGSHIFNSNNQRADAYGIPAILQPDGSDALAQWLVEVELPKGYTSLQVHAVAAP